MAHGYIEVIESISDLQELVKQGVTDFKEYGHVKTVLHESFDNDMILFAYTSKAQYENRWNYLERISRGLILNRETGKVMARPFDRFWNWGEHGRYGTGEIVLVTEKLDGSMIAVSGDLVTTRGSFTSEQALWAKEYIAKHHPDLTIPSDMTLMFEAIYPENRIIVDYHGEESLVLLAARNNLTGDYAPEHWLSWFSEKNGLLLRDAWAQEDVDLIINVANKHSGLYQEGYVIHMSDGSMWKIKGQDYVRLHKAISGLSLKNTAKACKARTEWELFDLVPDEFLDEYKEWVDIVHETIHETILEVEHFFHIAPKESRKEFATWVNDKVPLWAPYLFKRYDGKDYTDLIYKKELGV